ncbi:hypothetical protein PG990_002418 [Apiospora arundinis]
METLGSIFTKSDPWVGQTAPSRSASRKPKNPRPNKESGKAYFKTIEPADNLIEKTIKSTRELEIKGLEKALEAGLEKTLAHVVAMLGIILSTGLAPYMSVEFEKSNAIQLGSYALLLAVATGVTALFSSATHVTNAQESLKLLLRLQEHLVEKPNIENPNRHFNPYDQVHLDASERAETKTRIEISFSDILKETRGLRRWGCLIFGRGIAFLPSRDRSKRGMKAYWSRPYKLRSATVQFSTEGIIRCVKEKSDTVEESGPGTVVEGSQGGPGATTSPESEENPNGQAMRENGETHEMTNLNLGG